MKATYTTIHVRAGDVELLDQYAVDEFGSTDVPYRVVLRHLLGDDIDDS